MVCSEATCLHGLCRLGSCVCKSGFLGVECHESMAVESKKPLYIAFLVISVSLFGITFLFNFFQLLRALYISFRNKRCTAVPKTLCLAFLTICALFGTINYSDPWGYRRKIMRTPQFFMTQILLITFFSGNYPMWRMWFQLQQAFDKSRFLAWQSRVALTVIILFSICTLTTATLAALAVISFGGAQSITITATVISIGYFMTIPSYFGWKIMRQLDQSRSRNELKAMTVLVMGCSILYLFEFILLTVQAIILPSVLAYSRTREILGFFIVPTFIAEVLLVTVILAKHNSEELKRKPLTSPRRRDINRKPRIAQTPLTPLTPWTPRAPDTPSHPPLRTPTSAPDLAKDSDPLLANSQATTRAGSSNNGNGNGSGSGDVNPNQSEDPRLSVVIHLPSGPQHMSTNTSGSFRLSAGALVSNDQNSGAHNEVVQGKHKGGNARNGGVASDENVERNKSSSNDDGERNSNNHLLAGERSSVYDDIGGERNSSGSDRNMNNGDSIINSNKEEEDVRQGRRKETIPESPEEERDNDDNERYE